MIKGIATEHIRLMRFVVEAVGFKKMPGATEIGRCINCGGDTKPGANFCAQCGHRIGDPSVRVLESDISCCSKIGEIFLRQYPRFVFIKVQKVDEWPENKKSGIIQIHRRTAWFRSVFLSEERDCVALKIKTGLQLPFDEDALLFPGGEWRDIEVEVLLSSFLDGAVRASEEYKKLTRKNAVVRRKF